MAAVSDRFREVVEETRAGRARVRELVQTKRWQEAEPDSNRLAGYLRRKTALNTPAGAEAIQGDTVDLQAAWFLPQGAQTRRAVAYVEVTAPGRPPAAGTGFMVSPRLFITNQHVIADETAARSAILTFDREVGDQGRRCPTTSFLLDLDSFALFSREEELDYALVAVGERTAGNAALEDFRFCILSDRPDKHALGMNVNIIQHPGGFPKMIAVRNNILQYRTRRTLLYETDTDHGSSGAPVFNDDWELVALHHYGEPFLERLDEQGNPIPANVNEGVRISAIYEDLAAKLPALPPAQRYLLAEALAYDKAIAAAGGRRLSPPHPSGTGAESRAGVRSGEEAPMPPVVSPQELRITLPIEIVVRVGATAGAGSQPIPIASAEPARTLARAAEKLQVDQDYSNRLGYDPEFIPGLLLPLPQPDANLGKQVAPLRHGEPDAASGLLNYEHFSIMLNKSKRIAIFTATNIDGETYLEVDRKTGQVTGAESGETWFADPRISADFFLDQTFYSEWSDYFDRGHLTRRSDPTWGTNEEAARANADTFHFTNCSPQHFRFNQSATFWQGAERYVLENGVLAAASRRRICVFQGPIFLDQIDRWAGDVQIPSSFFKVIVWSGEGGLKSVGLIVDQLALLDEERRSLGQPKPVSFVDVSHWRVDIGTIETRTGLDFGDLVRGADTIAQAGQPRPGEAIIPVKSLSDLLRG